MTESLTITALGSLEHRATNALAGLTVLDKTDAAAVLKLAAEVRLLRDEVSTARAVGRSLARIEGDLLRLRQALPGQAPEGGAG